MNNDESSKSVSDIQFAKALKAIRAVVSEEEFAKILGSLASEEEASTLAEKIAGLTEEDEFAVLCRLMDTVSHISALEQAPIIPGGAITPDFLVRFQPGLWCEGKQKEHHQGFPCLVEVKSTSNVEWHISGSRLKKRRNFAAAFGLPLLFAVRFTKFPSNACWVIVHDDDWTKNRIDVGVGDLTSSLRHILFNEYWYMLHPGTSFEQRFDTDVSCEGAGHAQYGSLVAFQILTPEAAISFEGEEATLWSAFFEAFRLEETEKAYDASQTIVRLEPGVDACSIVDLVYCFNCLPTDEAGNRSYDPSRSIAHADRDPKALLIANRDSIAACGRTMQKLGVLWLTGVQDPEQHARRWRQYGGT